MVASTYRLVRVSEELILMTSLITPTDELVNWLPIYTTPLSGDALGVELSDSKNNDQSTIPTSLELL